MNTLATLTALRFTDPSPKSRLERFLSHFADVRAGEGVEVLLLALNLSLLLAAYYMLKTAREALILTEGGAEVKRIRRRARRCCCWAWCPCSERSRRA